MWSVVEFGIPVGESSALDALDQEKRLHVFRIIQEALTNIEKHAESKAAILTVREVSDTLFCIISDEGKGFTVPPPDHSGQPGLGIRGMKARTAMIGATLTIDSEKGEGTTLTLKVPLQKEQA